MIQKPDPGLPLWRYPYPSLPGGVPIVVDGASVAVLAGPQGILGVLGPGHHVIGPQGTPQLAPFVGADGQIHQVTLYIVARRFPPLPLARRCNPGGTALDVGVEVTLAVDDPSAFVAQLAHPSGGDPGAVTAQLRGQLEPTLEAVVQQVYQSGQLNTGPMGLLHVGTSLVSGLQQVDLRWAGMRVERADNTKVGLAAPGSPPPQPGGPQGMGAPVPAYGAPPPKEDPFKDGDKKAVLAGGVDGGIAGHHVRVKGRLEGVGVSVGTDGIKVDKESVKEKVKSEIMWYAIGAVVVLAVICLFCGIGGYVWYKVREGTGGGSTETEAWSGSTPYTCMNGNRRIEGATAAFASGTAIQAIGNCHLELVNVTVSSSVALDVGGNAEVTVTGGALTGSEAAIRAGGNAQVHVRGAQINGATQTNANGRIDGI